MLLDDYTLTQPLGRGTFGDVFLTSKKNSTTLYATKRMDRALAEHPSYCKYFVNEVSILRNIYHKNIVKVEGLKKTKNHYYIIMELCDGGSLKSNLEKYMNIYKKPFSEKIVQHLMRQIVSAVNYLHGLKIVHRDLKLENILVNYNSIEDKKNVNLLKAEIKIVDFGFATHISNASLLKTAIGSPFNMDPRILKKFNCHAKCPQSYDEKADIWSLGTLCYQMLIGDYAFTAKSVQELSSKIEEGNFKVPIYLARETISFLINMLQYNPAKRMSASELSKHPFLNKYIDDFSYVDIQKVSSKVNYGDLYINIKDNETICSIVNKEGVKQFNIAPSDLFPLETGTQYFPQNKNEIKQNINGQHQINNMNNLDSNNNNNNFSTKKEMLNSAPIPNISNKDPVMTTLLDIKIPQSQKNVLNSLIHINENTEQLSKSTQKNNTGQFFINNTFEGQQIHQNQNNISNSAQKVKNEIIPNDVNKMNLLNQQIKAVNNTPQKNNNIINQTKTFPTKQNNSVNQLNFNFPNNSFGNNNNKVLLNATFQNYQNFQRFNSLQPQFMYNQYGTAQINDGFSGKKIIHSDKQLLNMNQLNTNNRNRIHQQFSSKNIDPKQFNLMNTHI